MPDGLRRVSVGNHQPCQTLQLIQANNLAHLWKTGGTPAPAARHSPHAPAPPPAEPPVLPSDRFRGSRHQTRSPLSIPRRALSTAPLRMTYGSGTGSACRDRSNRFNGPPRSCACSPGGPAASAWSSCRRSWACPRGRSSGSCAPSSRSASSRRMPNSGKYQLGAGAAPPREQLPRRQRAAHPGAELGRLAGRPQQRGGADRHPPRLPGCWWSTTSSAPTTATRCSRWARCSPSTHRHGQDPARRQPLPARQLGAEELTRFTPRTITDAKQLSARAQARSRGAAGRRTSGSWSTARGRSRRPITDRRERDRRGHLHLRAGRAAVRVGGAAQRLVVVRARIGAGDLPRPGGDPVVAGSGRRGRGRVPGA